MKKIIALLSLPLLWAVGSPALRAQRATVRNLQITENVVSRYATGIELRFELTYDPGAKARLGSLDVYLGAGGATTPLRSRIEGKGLTDDDGLLRLLSKDKLATEARTEAHVVFVPYAAIGLPAGRHALSLLPRWRRGLGGMQTLEVVTEGVKEVDFAMPALRTLAVSVERAEVEPANAKGKAWDELFSIGNSPRGKPDLQWRLVLETSTGELLLHKSEEVSNATEGDFSRTPVSIHLAPNDRVGLVVVDVDELQAADRIGERYFTADELLRMAAEPTPLQMGRVRALELGSVSEK